MESTFRLRRTGLVCLIAAPLCLVVTAVAMGRLTWPGVAALAAITSLGGGWLWLASRSGYRRDPAPRRNLEHRWEGSVRTVDIPAIDGLNLEAWLFLPHASPAPLVVMAPGLTGGKDGHLEPFAWQFARRGIGVLLIDFRGFGGSQGPRGWVDPSRQRQDYEAALRFARGPLAERGLVDPARIALWGTSFSGGTALRIAGDDPGIAAVVAQAPFLETPAHLQPSGLRLARFVLWATLDLLRLLPPIYVPVFGRPGEWVFCPSRENPSVRDPSDRRASSFWRTLPSPQHGGWENKMRARVLAAIDEYRGMDAVPKLRCPTMFVAAEKDDLVPVELVRRAHAEAPAAKKRLFVLDVGHFDLYVGDQAPHNRMVQADFLALHLGTPAAPAVG